MNRKNLYILLFVALFGASAFPFEMAEAASPQVERIKKAARIERRIERLQARLSRLFESVPIALQARLVERRKTRSLDSDGDGVSDSLERQGGRCDDDSDDDGLDDYSEFLGNTDPGDDDTDDDGYSDNDEFEREGVLSAISEAALEVSGVTFLIDGGTQFFNRRGEEVDASLFAVGLCIEVEGHMEGENIIADEVEAEDDCDDSSDDDDDDDDDDDQDDDSDDDESED